MIDIKEAADEDYVDFGAVATEPTDSGAEIEEDDPWNDEEEQEEWDDEDVAEFGNLTQCDDCGKLGPWYDRGNGKITCADGCEEEEE